MAESVVSLTYGTALYEAAKDLGKEEEILIEIKQLALLVQAYEDFSEFSEQPGDHAEGKKRSCKKNHAACFLAGDAQFRLCAD